MRETARLDIEPTTQAEGGPRTPAPGTGAAGLVLEYSRASLPGEQEEPATEFKTNQQKAPNY